MASLQPTAGAAVTRRRSSRKQLTVFDICSTCNEQMYGGPRCPEHNPTPEQREANPQVYRVEHYAPSYKKAPS